MPHILYGYQLDSAALIVLPWIYPRRLSMAAGFCINSLSLLNMARTEHLGLNAGQPARWLKAIESS